MPKAMVQNVVTPRVLEMDRRSCDNLLNEILRDKQQDDKKKAEVKI